MLSNIGTLQLYVFSFLETTRCRACIAKILAETPRLLPKILQLVN